MISVNGASGSRAASILVAVAAAIVLVGAAVPLFLNPVWVAFEQERSRADLRTGYPAAEVHRVTNAVLADLVVGPPEFDVQAAGRPVFEERERSHLRDVRTVLLGFGLTVLVAAVVLVAAWRIRRGGAAFWSTVKGGATVLAGGVVIVGAVFAFAFELAFEVFHRIFFAGGTYTFDPRTERLVQLFPGQFWYETSITLGVVVLVAALALRWLAGRRIGPLPAPRPEAAASLEAVR